MVQKGTFVYVGDNTGAVWVKCIHLYGGFYKKKARVTDYILIAIQKRRLLRKFINNFIYLALLITQKKNFFRLNGYYIKFYYNKILLLTEAKKLVGTRVLGTACKELIYFNNFKIMSLVKKLC
jgi:ribosomal protein L14